MRLGLVLLLSAATATQAQEVATTGLNLLATGDGRVLGVRAEVDTPWERLPAEVRGPLHRVLRNQLDYPGVSTSSPRPENLAKGNAAAVYGRWQRTGGSASTWPSFFFNEGLDEEGRRILLCVYAKFEAEGLWQEIETFESFKPTSPWPGMWVMPRKSHAEFRRFLSEHDYGDWFSASRDPRWGVRKGKPGAQFHIIGPHPDWDQRFIECHIDLSNPGDSDGLWDSTGGYVIRGLGHAINDSWWPERERIADPLKEALVDQGLDVPDVDQTTFGSTTMANFVKYDTPDKYFGHLWLRPKDRKAGWWTTYEKSRNFDRVELRSSDPVVFRLTYCNGYVDVTITETDEMEAIWHKRGRRKVIDFDGDLEWGHVYIDG